MAHHVGAGRLRAGFVLALGAAAGLSAQVAGTAMVGGGDVSMTQAGDLLRVSVRGAHAGLASLCVGDESRVRILHASAAVGEAVYERTGQHWELRSDFVWKIRDSRTTAATDADRQRVFAELGWIANASSAGDPTREFTIRLSDRIRFVGVTFLSTEAPMAVSYWPSSMGDGCREIRIAQGFLPQTAQFSPATWHRLK